MKAILGVLSIFVVTGCTSNVGTPLIFSSSQTVGLGLTSSATENQGIEVTFGYKSRDVALVPTTTQSQSGELVQIQGCYRVGQNTGNVGDCASEGAAALSGVSKGNVSWKVGEDLTSLVNESSGGQSNIYNIADVRIPDTPPAPAAVQIVPFSKFSPQPVLPAPVTPQTIQALPLPKMAVPVLAGNNQGNQAQSIKDALSVYSSFEGNTKAKATNGEVGIVLGKAFATGVAAQHLTEGMNYFLQYKGASLVGGAAAATKADCLRELTAAMGAGKVTEAAAKICSG